MKKLFKSLLVLVCAGSLCAGALALSACNSGTKGEAYGLVHGAGYVGYSTVTVSGETVKNATLTEVCFPTQVPEVAADKEAGTAAKYYAEVTYNDVTMKYDETAKTYKVGNDTLKDFFKDATKCEEYVKAVKDGKVCVTVDGAKKTGVMTWKALCKDNNGYWDGESIHEGQLGWKANRDATLKYVKNGGIKNLLTLVKATEGENEGYWVDVDGVSTGATWNDMNSRKEGSLSYAELIVKAYDAAVKAAQAK